MRSAAPITVLHSVQLDGGATGYVDHLVGAFAADEVQAVPFSYRRALAGRWDVLHVHWPENLARGQGRSRRVVRKLCLLALLLRLRCGRRAVVRTVHNVRPHEPGGRLERALLAALDRRVTDRVHLNAMTPAPAGARVTTIAHGHYVEQLGTAGAVRPVPRTLLFFGFLRHYKGLDVLLDAFRGTTDGRARLSVVGFPVAADVGTLVERACAADPRITAVLDFVPDDELAGRIAAASLVVLPYPDLHNSGAVFAALSVGRPVLVPDNEVTRALGAEVGKDFVLGYRPPLTGADLTAALDRVDRRPAHRRPDLGGRSWTEVAAAYVEVYRTALARGL